MKKKIAIDVIPVAVKSPKIVDWKIYKEGKKSYYQIVRADEKSQMYMIFSQMLKSFDRKDLKDLYKLIKARYGSTRPVRSMNYLLWNDMKIMFEPHVEDEGDKDFPSLPSAPSLVPPSDNLSLIVRQTHTPATIDTESEPEGAPSETEEFEASKPSNIKITSPHFTAPSDSTTPLSPNYLLAQTSPTPTQASYYYKTARMVMRTHSTLSPGMSAQTEEASTLSPSLFRKRYRSSYETPSPSSSLTLPIRKRYQGTSKHVEDNKDESLDSYTKREEEEEEAAPEGHSQAVPIMDTAVDEPLGLGYEALSFQRCGSIMTSLHLFWNMEIWFKKTSQSSGFTMSKGLITIFSQLLIEIILFIVNFRCSKHMTGNLMLLINYVEKFLGTVRLDNDQFAPILEYGDMV
nr:hypothetical protein [Tanacetum cinerariifolium]